MHTEGAGPDQGQGLVEYALILVLVVLVVILILAIMGPGVGNMYSSIIHSIPQP